MKRIAIFCDGTWNGLQGKYATNVRISAELTKQRAPDGVAQIVYYGEGVGTSIRISSWLENQFAGAFGLGLFEKIADAYRFLVFNYEPGDEIFIFGFSRGAYTARSLAGLIRKCGIISKSDSGQILNALTFYKDPRSHPDSDAAQQFRLENSPGTVLKDQDRNWRQNNGLSAAAVAKTPKLNIKFLGVWDTVGALGVPQHLLISKLFRTNKRYAFHDTELSSTIHAARHAVSVDENRLSFRPSLWSNLAKLNSNRGETQFLQHWFPGDHGSVGGGGDIVGLSHAALVWILEGASRQGLELDNLMLEKINLQINPLVSLTNSSEEPGFLERIYRRKSRIGPADLADLAEITVQRMEAEFKSKHDASYRPQALKHFHQNAKTYVHPKRDL